MKVKMLTLSADPRGVVKPGTIIDVPDEEAKQLIAARSAEPVAAAATREAKARRRPAALQTPAGNDEPAQSDDEGQDGGEGDGASDTSQGEEPPAKSDDTKPAPRRGRKK